MSKVTFKVGDRVQFSGKFLQSTGQVAGGEGRKVWTILHVDDRHGSTIVQVNEPATLDYYSAEELAADPSLRNRRINAANLKHYGKPSSRDA